MPNVWVARTKSGLHTPEYVDGGYAAVGWVGWEETAKILSLSWDELKQKHSERELDDSPHQVSAKMAQLWKFLHEIQPGDYIINPSANINELRYGVVEGNLYYDTSETYKDGCLWPHRRRVKWCEKKLSRQSLPNRLRHSLDYGAKTLFGVSEVDEFLIAIGKKSRTPPPDPVRVVLDHILTLSPSEFEDLVADLLIAIGLKEVELMPPFNPAVDIVGVLDTAGLVNIKMFVQVKHHRYAKVGPSVVNALRGALPEDGQGAIVTTSDFNGSTRNAANKPGFKPIALVTGRQLVNLLIEHWDSDSLARGDGGIDSWHERLRLTTGLVGN